MKLVEKNMSLRYVHIIEERGSSHPRKIVFLIKQKAAHPVPGWVVNVFVFTCLRETEEE